MVDSKEPRATNVLRDLQTEFGATPTHDMDGIVLAGGRGSRMCLSGAGTPPPTFDKGLVRLAGRSLIDYVAATLRPMVGTLFISASQHPEAYTQWGVCVPDRPDALGHIPYAGPLAGVLAGLDHSRADWLAVAPCDSPFLPPDWARVLRAHAEHTQASVAVARHQGTRHSVCMVVRSDMQRNLSDFLAAGERKVGLWQREANATEVAFDAYAQHAFMNINTPSDLDQAEALIASGAASVGLSQPAR